MWHFTVSLRAKTKIGKGNAHLISLNKFLPTVEKVMLIPVWYLNAPILEYCQK
jgi:hypothetical protein